MKKLVQIFAYTWAIICALLIPVTFMGNGQFATLLSKLPFMKVSPIYSGGVADRVIEKSGMKITINKPVFEALIGESREGFVQIRFSDSTQLPATIMQVIDYNNDGSGDFILNINTRSNQTQMEPINKNVRQLIVSSKVKNDWIVRVGLVHDKK
jgi:hypothetical protein